MEDVNISKYRASVVREGSKPASPGFVVSEGQSPTDPAGTGQNHLPVTIAAASTGLSITESQILSGAGTVSQYIRGDGSLADFPEASGGGSSISYYLNGSISQGTIGGVAYKELNKVPILGAGTDFTINADGYIASFLTDAGDPNLLEIPGGNWNFETYFSSSSSGGTPTFYVELYKYDGTTFTLIASNSGSPEFIAFGTTLTAYFSTLAVPTTTLALTDRLAVRYYVTHSGRTITLHTEDNNLCQIITTFTTGLTALNGLTAQVQNFAVGTSGTDFNIASASATHTFNLPTASATNRGALSSADWSTFNGKQNALTLTTTGSSGAATLIGSTLNIPNYSPDLSGYVPTSRTITINGTTQDLSANRTFNVGTVTSVGLSSATSGVTIGSTPVTGSGTITLAIATASGSQNGLLSSTDWTTFNSKQNALTNPVTGTGTTNYLAKFTGSTTVGNSQVFDNGTTVFVNATTAPGLGSPEFFVKMATANSYEGILVASSTNNNVIAVAHTGSIGLITTNWGTSGAATPLAFGTSGAEQMRLSTNGNVRIGTSTSSSPRFTVAQLYSSHSMPSLGNLGGLFGFFNTDLEGGEVKYGLVGGISGATGNVSLQVQRVDGTATAYNLIMQQNGGNVLIGTTTDNGARLQVSGTATFSSTGNAVRISSTSTASNVQLYITNNNNGDIYAGVSASDGSSVFTGTTAYSGYIGTNLNVPFYIATNGIARMAITSSGNVGIGTTSPSSKLQIEGTGTGAWLTINRTDSGTNVIDYTQSGTRLGYIGYIGSDLYLNNATASATAFFTNSTERMRITSGGNVGIGTASPISRFMVQDSANTYVGHFSGLNQTNGVALGTNSSNVALIQGYTRTFSATNNIAMQADGGNVMIGSTTDNGSKLQVNGAIRTAQPVGTTSNGWLLGRALVSGTSTPDRWIRVQIGLEYYDILAVYMGTL